MSGRVNPFEDSLEKQYIQSLEQAINELKKEIEDLTARVATLEGGG